MRALRYDGPSMATIWKSRGTGGPESTDAGTQMPLWLIDERLKGRQLAYLGEDLKPIDPASPYFLYIVIEVTSADEPTDRFPKVGFYRIVGLHLEQASFLFQAPSYV